MIWATGHELHRELPRERQYALGFTRLLFLLVKTCDARTMIRYRFDPPGATLTQDLKVVSTWCMRDWAASRHCHFALAFGQGGDIDSQARGRDRIARVCLCTSISERTVA